MSTFFEALQQKFGAQIQSMSADHEEEIYLLVGDPNVRITDKKIDLRSGSHGIPAK